MKVTRKIDTKTATYDLTGLSHDEIMKIYEGLSHFYSYCYHRHIKEIEEDLPKKICEIISLEEKTI